MMKLWSCGGFGKNMMAKVVNSLLQIIKLKNAIIIVVIIGIKSLITHAILIGER